MYSQISMYMLHATICELCINRIFLFEKLRLRMMKLVSRCYQHEFVSVDNKSITLSDMTLIVVRLLAVIHFLSDRQIAMPWIFESATQSKYCSGEHYFLGSRVNGHLMWWRKAVVILEGAKGRNKGMRNAHQRRAGKETDGFNCNQWRKLRWQLRIGIILLADEN